MHGIPLTRSETARRVDNHFGFAIDEWPTCYVYIRASVIPQYPPLALYYITFAMVRCGFSHAEHMRSRLLQSCLGLLPPSCMSSNQHRSYSSYSLTPLLSATPIKYIAAPIHPNSPSATSTLQTIQPQSRVINLFTDASGKKGIGDNHAFSSSAPRSHRRKHINWKEAPGNLYALAI